MALGTSEDAVTVTDSSVRMCCPLSQASSSGLIETSHIFVALCGCKRVKSLDCLKGVFGGEVHLLVSETTYIALCILVVVEKSWQCSVLKCLPGARGMF